MVGEGVFEPLNTEWSHQEFPGWGRAALLSPWVGAGRPAIALFQDISAQTSCLKGILSST